MPAGTSPFKQAHDCLRRAAAGNVPVLCGSWHGEEPGMPPLEVSGWEVAQAAAGSRNYTVLTLEMLARENPGAVLYLAIGSDMLLSFEGWHRWQDILRLARVVVTSRNAAMPRRCTQRPSCWTRRADASCLPRCTALPMASSQLRPRLPPERSAKPNCRRKCAPSSGGRNYTGTQKEVADNGAETGKGACAQSSER